MKYTLSYLIKGGGRHESSWDSSSDAEAIEIARKHMLSKAGDRALRFTPVLSCGETQHNLLPYYSHDDETNYYDRRSQEGSELIQVNPISHPGKTIYAMSTYGPWKIDRRTS